MKKSFLLFLLSLIPGCLLFGQNQIIPPSPNATSLGQYGDVPVSNYTGVPSISIPLYTIKSGEIELPISLSYHASGIKVAQEASWVGLGWSLNAGGVITRQVNGLDDFDDRGFIGAPELPISGTPMWSCIHNNDPTSIREKLFEYDAGMEDAQPDDFYFNFFGRSGRLIFQKQDGNIIKAIAAEQNNMVFYYDKSTDQWEIIDGKGWRYYFHTTEISRNSSETSNLPIGYPSSNPWSEEITTAWYIDRVETPRGAEINFFYGETGRWIDEQVNYSQKRYDREIEFDVNGESGFVASHILGNYTNRYSASVSQVNEVYLQRIDFENGYIEFGLSDRQDRITSLNATPSKSLSNIWIYNTDGKMIKQITFSYGYFNSDKLNTPDQEKYLRLKLTQIQEWVTPEGQGYVGKPPYIFNYNTTDLPAKTSSSIDHWGYYNGADNENIRNYRFYNLDLPGYEINDANTDLESTMVPLYSYVGQTYENEFVKIFVNGANREPNEIKMKAASLESIEYPSGGVTKLNLEANDYFYDPNDHPYDNYKLGGYEMQIDTLQVNSHGTIEKSIHITEPTFTCLSYTLHNAWPGTIGVIEDMKATLQKIEGTDTINIIQFEPKEGDDAEYDSAYVCVALEPGDYSIVADHGGYYYLDISLEAKVLNQVLTNYKMAGGLRIQSIKNYDEKGGNLLTSKLYNYESQGKSTGRLMSPIINMYNETEFTYAAVEGHDPRSLIRSIINPPLQDHFNYITNWGHSIVPMGTSAGGNSIGYDSVFVRKKNQQGLTTGSSTFSYINYVEEPYGIFFPGVPNIKKLNNGQLLKEEYFNNNGIKVKAKEITYTEELSTSKKVNGIITKTPVCEYLDPADLVSIDEVIFARIYNDNSQWFYPSREVDITYDVKGLNPVYDTTIYEYNNSEHKQLSKKTKISSEGKKIVQKFKYPSDFTNLPSTTDSYDDIEVRGLKAMVDNNIQIKPIETIKLVNDSITGGNINTFILNKYNHIVPYSKLILETKDSRPIDDDNPNNLWMFNQTYLDYENGQWLFKEDDLYPADDAPNYLYHYDQNGNLVQVDKKDDITTSYIWGYNNEYPIAKIKNAKDSSWYFDGFESGTFDENIGWDHHGAGDRVVTDEASHTGKYSVKFTDANSWSGVYLNSPYIKVTPGEQYTISAWFKCDETKYAYINWYDFTNGVSHTKTKQGTGKWTYIEHTYTVPSNCKELRVYLYGHHTNSNTIYYDDIRVYPDNSQMNTYTYDPLIGITSKTDQSNNTTFYFYDEFGRLKTIKDNDLNIIKDFDYQYGNQ